MPNKNFKFMAIGLLLAACGGLPEDQSEADVPQMCEHTSGTNTTTCHDLSDDELIATLGAAPQGEIGQSEQALSVDEGYGAEEGAVDAECYVPWGGGRCLLPKDKTFKIKNNSCSFSDGTGDLEPCQAAFEAATAWKDYLNAQGFSVSFVNSGVAGLDTTYTGGTAGTSHTDEVLGQAVTQFNTGEQVNGPGGKYERTINCTVTVDFLEIKNAMLTNRTQYPTIPNSAGRSNAYFNAALHEFGHCTGLGHHEILPVNIMKSKWPSVASRLTFVTFQRDWFAHYVAF